VLRAFLFFPAYLKIFRENSARVYKIGCLSNTSLELADGNLDTLSIKGTGNGKINRVKISFDLAGEKEFSEQFPGRKT
jgi:hypothetical protein